MSTIPNQQPDHAQHLLLLFTHSPSHPLSQLGLRFAKSYLHQQTMPTDQHLSVFFYADGAYIANRLYWQSAEQPNLTKDWQQLAEIYDLALPVCVSTALARGISDKDNALRHHLSGDNLADEFSLVGLGDLAHALHQADKIIQF